MKINSLGSVKLSKLERIVESVKKYYEETSENFEDIELSAEFLIPSCFPEIYKNFQNKIQEQYTKGYIAGMAEKEKNEAKVSE